MEFILTFFIVVIVVLWLFAKLFPRLLAWYIKRKVSQGGTFGRFAGNGFAGPGRNRERQEEEIRRSKEQEGKVTVVKMEETEKVIENNMGEYVDFEEEK